MNLIDNETFCSLTLSVNYNKFQTNTKVYGAYQHVQENLTLAQYQKYTIDSFGYGGVIKFDNFVRNLKS